MLSTRVKAALVFVPLVLIFIYLGGWAFNLFILALLLLAAHEYARLFTHTGYDPSIPVLLAGVLLFTLQRWFLDGEYLGFLISITLFLTIVPAIFQFERGYSKAVYNFAVTFSGILYLGWVGTFLISLRALPDGLGWTLTALPVTWLADSGAYFIGRWLGKHKFSPRTSPNKTWAGFASAVLWGVPSGLLLVLLWRTVGFLPAQTPLWQGAVMGLTLAVLTPIGDLFVSLIKRTAGVKDTGNLIPGHGGILDRIDTWIWAALIGYYLVITFQGLM